MHKLTINDSSDVFTDLAWLIWNQLICLATAMTERVACFQNGLFGVMWANHIKKIKIKHSMSVKYLAVTDCWHSLSKCWGYLSKFLNVNASLVSSSYQSFQTKANHGDYTLKSSAIVLVTCHVNVCVKWDLGLTLSKCPRPDVEKDSLNSCYHLAWTCTLHLLSCS